MTPLDYASPFVDMTCALEEHDWMTALYHRMSPNNDAVGRSLQPSRTSSDETCFTPLGLDGSGASRDDTQYLPILENEASAMSSLNPGQAANVTTSAASATAAALCQDQSSPGIDISVKRTRGYKNSQVRPRKQRGPEQAFQCHWKDCKQQKPFCGKPALMRHIDTQHVDPRAFDCPLCTKSFNRKDNLTEHLGRVHRVLS